MYVYLWLLIMMTCWKKCQQLQGHKAVPYQLHIYLLRLLNIASTGGIVISTGARRWIEVYFNTKCQWWVVGYATNHLSSHSRRLQYILLYTSNSNTIGSSTADLTLRKNRTASRPSISRWSYVKATYIMGRISTYTDNENSISITHSIFNVLYNSLLHTPFSTDYTKACTVCVVTKELLLNMHI